MLLSLHKLFRAALRRGDLDTVRIVTAELGYEVNLLDDLLVVLLTGRKEPTTYDGIATKWLARLIGERPGIQLEDLRVAVNVLEAYWDNPAGSHKGLIDLCNCCGFTPRR